MMYKQMQQISQQRNTLIKGKIEIQGLAADLTVCSDFENAAKLNMALQLIQSVEISLEKQHAEAH